MCDSSVTPHGLHANVNCSLEKNMTEAFTFVFKFSLDTFSICLWAMRICRAEFTKFTTNFFALARISMYEWMEVNGSPKNEHSVINYSPSHCSKPVYCMGGKLRHFSKISSFHSRKKVTPVGNNIRGSKSWENFYFLLNYPIKSSSHLTFSMHLKSRVGNGQYNSDI